MAISRILDEADIVEAFLRHTAAYADHHVILDNGSRDGTQEILRALKEEGLALTVFESASVSFYQTEANTVLFRHAGEILEADWVLCLDADEFVDDRAVAGGLRAALAAALAEDVRCLTVPLRHYEPAADDDASEPVVPLRMRRCAGLTDVTKVFVRGSETGARIGNGNHDAAVDGQPLEGRPVLGLALAHYPYRSPHQRAAKCVKGWSKVTAAGSIVVGRGTSRHYRSLFEIIRDRPQEYFRNRRFQRPRPHTNRPVDPIDYRGGPLRHSADTDEMMRALRSLAGYLEDLAAQHGRLLEEVPEARDRVAAWNSEIRRLF